VRRLFSWARMEPIEVSYTIAGNDNRKRAGELLITSP